MCYTTTRSNAPRTAHNDTTSGEQHMIAITQNLELHDRTRRVETQHHFLQRKGRKQGDKCLHSPSLLHLDHQSAMPLPGTRSPTTTVSLSSRGTTSRGNNLKVENEEMTLMYSSTGNRIANVSTKGPS